MKKFLLIVFLAALIPRIPSMVAMEKIEKHEKDLAENWAQCYLCGESFESTKLTVAISQYGLWNDTALKYCCDCKQKYHEKALCVMISFIKKKGTEAYFGGMNLTELPSRFYKLEGIKVLHLARNFGFFLDDKVAHLKNLKELYLGGCCLKSLSDAVCSLEQLEKLTLFYNPGIEIPCKIAHLKNLKELSLGYCELKAIPNDVYDLESLEDLDISGNPEITLDIERLRKLTKLRTVNLFDSGYSEESVKETFAGFKIVVQFSDKRGCSHKVKVL